MSDLRKRIFENINMLEKDEYPSMQFDNNENAHNSLSHVEYQESLNDNILKNNTQFSMVAIDTYQKIIENIYERLDELEQQLEQIGLDSQMNCEKCVIGKDKYCLIDPNSIEARLDSVREGLREIDAEVGQKKLNIDIPDLTKKIYKIKDQNLQNEQKCVSDYRSAIGELESLAPENSNVQELVTLSQQILLIEEELNKLEVQHDLSKNRVAAECKNIKLRKRFEILRESAMQMSQLRKNQKNITRTLTEKYNNENSGFLSNRENNLENMNVLFEKSKDLSKSIVDYLKALSKLCEKLNSTLQKLKSTYLSKNNQFGKIVSSMDFRKTTQFNSNNLTCINIVPKVSEIEQSFKEFSESRLTFGSLNHLTKKIQKFQKFVSSLIFQQGISFDDNWQSVFEKFKLLLIMIGKEIKENNNFDISLFEQIDEDFRKINKVIELIGFSRDVIIPNVDHIYGELENTSREIEELKKSENLSNNNSISDVFQNKLRFLCDSFDAKKCELEIETRKKIDENNSLFDCHASEKNEQNEIDFGAKKNIFKENFQAVLSRMKIIQQNIFNDLNIEQEKKAKISSLIGKIVSMSECLREGKKALFESKKDIEKLILTKEKNKELPRKISRIKENLDRTEDLVGEKKSKVFNLKLEPIGIYFLGNSDDMINIGDLLKFSINTENNENLKNYNLKESKQEKSDKKKFQFENGEIIFDATGNTNLRLTLCDIDGTILIQEDFRVNDFMTESEKNIFVIENELFRIPIKWKKFFNKF